MKTPTVGILGGGQLAQMLILAAHHRGLKTYCLSPSPQDPAAQVTPHWMQGDPNLVQDLKRFFDQVDIITFESEFASIPHLREAQHKKKIPFFPSLDQMERLQDRWTQKLWLAENHLPTAPFLKVENQEELFSLFNEVSPNKMVFKKRTHGYDGYGTFVLQSKTDYLNFAQSHNLSDFIVEAFIPFKRELSLMVFRNTSGEISFFPLVESHQKDSKCLWVKGPEKHPKLRSLKVKIQKALNDMDYVGAIAFELFDYNDQLWINEVAPRVHNTGHFSQEALVEDQFQLHIKCLLGESLPDKPYQPPGFAMFNLIGSKTSQPKGNLPKNVQLHWYGKSENRPGRKMGHLNTVDKTPQSALQRVIRAAKEFQL